MGSKEQVKAMDSITEIIKPGFMADGGEEVLPFAFSRRYINWSTNKVSDQVSIKILMSITASLHELLKGSALRIAKKLGKLLGNP